METKYRTECQRALKTTEPDECERLLQANNDITDLQVPTALKNKDPLQCVTIIETESLFSRHTLAMREALRKCQSRNALIARHLKIFPSFQEPSGTGFRS